MMVAKRTWVVMLIVLIISGCSSSEEGRQETQTIVSDQFTTYDLSQDVPSKKLVELIDNIQFTRLEETEESLLSYVREFQFMNEQIVFANLVKGDVYVFSESGEFINVVNRKGDGPEEYSGVKDFWIDGESILIYTTKNEIKEYTLNGDYLGSTEIDLDAAHLIPYNDGYLLDMNFGLVNDSLKYLLVRLNGQLEVDEMLLPFETEPALGIVTSSTTLSRYNESISYLRILSDTTFLYNEDGIRPFIHYHFGNNWFWEDDMTRVAAFESIGDSEKVWNLNDRIGRYFIYLEGYVNFGPTDGFLIDRLKHKSVRVNKQKPTGENYSLSISHWDQSYAYGSLSSLDVAELIKDLDESQWSFSNGTTLEEIESSENPVLIKLKFKSGGDW